MRGSQYIYVCRTFSFVALSEIRPFRSKQNSPSPSFTQQTCAPCDTADMSAVGQKQTCLLCHTADMSAV